ncbi:uncharacterized protein LOC111372498 isoform X2 [Olea europaea var. sylvestris]|uniref:uncharacterized protein LOC111372498 isoform X2 n=1 Tax=Olea europaea var. sylvestris TaxID=158386 RepID=UPI000C1CE59C|nr:uncharacterized protein LOC111372498 isoform X2 [Olea europaea var. sylvestris]
MDYSLGALKLLCIQLKNARQAPSPKAFTLGGILFQRAWLQGVLVSTPSSSHSGGGGFHLDDGTGVIELLLSGDLRNRNWETGMYVMVVGFYSIANDGTSVLKVKYQSLKSWNFYMNMQIWLYKWCKVNIYDALHEVKNSVTLEDL